MGKQRVTVLDTGTCNLASMRVGLERAGADVYATRDARAIQDAERLVLPGVGSFGAGMSRLLELDATDALRRRVAAGRPLLAVCLGMQLLCEGSEETPGARGLGAVPATVERFATAPTVPQLGWNRVEPAADCRLLEPGYAYYANSYRLASVPAGWRGAYSEHGERFVGAMERGATLCCQFHPELSGAWGQSLLRRWLATSKAGAPC